MDCFGSRISLYSLNAIASQPYLKSPLLSLLEFGPDKSSRSS
ncbi:hypothetical protein MESS2_1020011 [Mesorhizobium metallidurans STM 2683]|uniref:Uncharacterized protein n=1 Tax=Mesorhizobium metallidurans STM 2683 TaxID=1297569 RepID=M5EFN7_9HYPH|nr:hypothetical protein MESS2_1020011 [Mesorhizobium metallidurans STM 2683]